MKFKSADVAADFKKAFDSAPQNAPTVSPFTLNTRAVATPAPTAATTATTESESTNAVEEDCKAVYEPVVTLKEV